MSKSNDPSQLAFKKENYILLGAGVAVSLLGFLLMSGGGSEDPNVFSPELFSFRRVTLAPLLVLGGYGMVLYSIIKKPKQAGADASE